MHHFRAYALGHMAAHRVSFEQERSGNPSGAADALSMDEGPASFVKPSFASAWFQGSTREAADAKAWLVYFARLLSQASSLVGPFAVCQVPIKREGFGRASWRRECRHG